MVGALAARLPHSSHPAQACAHSREGVPSRYGCEPKKAETESFSSRAATKNAGKRRQNTPESPGRPRILRVVHDDASDTFISCFYPGRFPIVDHCATDVHTRNLPANILLPAAENLCRTTRDSRQRELGPLPGVIEHFQFETLCVSNHTACTAASRFTFFKGETLYSITKSIKIYAPCPASAAT